MAWEGPFGRANETSKKTVVPRPLPASHARFCIDETEETITGVKMARKKKTVTAAASKSKRRSARGGKGRGKTSAGAYVGLLNGVTGRAKQQARGIRAKKGVVAAVAFLRKARKTAKKK